MTQRFATARTHRVLARRLSASVLAATLGVALAGASVAGALDAHAATRVVVTTSKNATLGTIVVSGGRTLYTLNKKVCSRQCLKYWPALTLPAGVTKASAARGVVAAKLGRVKDAAGQWQVTYAGRALYFYDGDVTPGQTNGNNLTDSWGLWRVVVTTKHKATSTTDAPTTTSGSLGY